MFRLCRILLYFAFVLKTIVVFTEADLTFAKKGVDLKKLISLALTLILILSLASCSRWSAEESGIAEETVSAESTYNTQSIDTRSIDTQSIDTQSIPNNNSNSNTENTDSVSRDTVSTDIKNNEITPLLWKVTNRESGAVL